MKTAIKSLVKEGDELTVFSQGVERRGILVKLDDINPADISLHMELKDGKKFVCPVDNNIAFEFMPKERENNDNDEDEKDEDDYETWSKVELKTEAKDRGINFQASVSKRGLINLLTHNDSEKDEKPEKKEKKKKLTDMPVKDLKRIGRKLEITVKGLDKETLIKKIKKARKAKKG